MNGFQKDQNLDQRVIDGFGHEWATFDYMGDQDKESLDAQFLAYTSPIKLADYSKEYSVAADFGAGSGRWTSRLIPYFSKIYALEPSKGAVNVLSKKFSNESSIEILRETIGLNSIPDESLDMAMSLGVLHHIPNTGKAIQDIAYKIKPGGVFLCYLYYKLNDKPFYYRAMFRISNLFRNVISRMPQFMRTCIAKVIARVVYLPLALTSKKLSQRGLNVTNFPLHHYANMPFVVLQNDALDRFGTRLELRFSKEDIIKMLEEANFDLTTLVFSDVEPFWTFSIKKISFE